MPRTRLRSSQAFLCSLLCLASLLTWESASGQLVLGRITDARTNDPVRDAEVILMNEDRAVIAGGASNNRGLYAIRPDRPGILFLTVARLGYASGDTIRIVVPPENSAHVDLELQPEGIELPGLVVTASRLSSSLARMGFFDRQRQGQGRFFDSEEILAVRGRRLTDLFRRIPGVLVRENVPYFFRNMGLTPRRASCPPALVLDGMLVRGKDGFDLVPLEWVTGVEVYENAAAAPAQWQANAACGLIMLWTR